MRDSIQIATRKPGFQSRLLREKRFMAFGAVLILLEVGSPKFPFFPFGQMGLGDFTLKFKDAEPSLFDRIPPINT